MVTHKNRKGCPTLAPTSPNFTIWSGCQQPGASYSDSRATPHIASETFSASNKKVTHKVGTVDWRVPSSDKRNKATLAAFSANNHNGILVHQMAAVNLGIPWRVPKVQPNGSLQKSCFSCFVSSWAGTSWKVWSCTHSAALAPMKRKQFMCKLQEIWKIIVRHKWWQWWAPRSSSNWSRLS